MTAEERALDLAVGLLGDPSDNDQAYIARQLENAEQDAFRRGAEAMRAACIACIRASEAAVCDIALRDQQMALVTFHPVDVSPVALSTCQMLADMIQALPEVTP